MRSLYSSLAETIIYPLGDLALGTDIMKALGELEESQWWSEREIKSFQEEKLRNLLDHAYQNVPYYKQVFDEHGIKPSQITTLDDLRKLPILTRKNVKEHFPEKLVAKNVSRKERLPGMTGGSTGRPLQFYRHIHSTSQDWGATLRAWGWANYQLGDKYATLWGHPLTLKEQSRLAQRVQNLMKRNLLLSAYEIDEATLETYVSKLAKYKPKFIRAYASAVYLLARYMEQHSIKSIRPRAIFTTSETLFSNWRGLIEQQFGCKVFDNYGSGEIHAIASECEQHSGYHISAENVIVECVAPDGAPAKPATEGELVITDLNNYACPFIRYNIEDLGVLSDKPCRCGRGLPMLGSLEGRTSDVLRMPNGRLVPLGYWVVLFETLSGVEQYQIVQETPENLVVKIVKNSFFTPDDLTHVMVNMRRLGGEELECDIKIVDTIPVSASGKRRFVMSEVGAEYLHPHAV